MTGRYAVRFASNSVEAITRPFREVQALAECELEILRGIGDQRKRHAAGDELATEGDPTPPPCLIHSGWACRQRTLADGRRQILAFLLPGDSIGLTWRRTPEASSIVALTALETIDVRRMASAIDAGESPGLAGAVRIIEAREQFRLIDQIVRLGRQRAYERTAHLLLELHQRLAIVGLGENQRFALPLSQEILADALGLSMVHVNRILQQLRRERLIELRSGVAILLNAKQLTEIAEYRADPMTAPPPHQVERPAAA
jgi:CRP-like cAMP-binding protein